ncbi:hypothetical protein IX336_001544 [Porphyromonas levii]|nr:hypothetical protein [Porphyromonas levii]
MLIETKLIKTLLLYSPFLGYGVSLGISWVSLSIFEDSVNLLHEDSLKYDPFWSCGLMRVSSQTGHHFTSRE